MFSLVGKHAVVTGCKGRLGPIWIAALKQAGATITGSDLPAVVGGFFGAAGAGSAHGDIRNRQEVQDLVEFVCAAFQRIDIWVNNAGVDDRPGDPGDRAQKAKEMAETNLLGTYWCLEIVGEQMKRQGHGVIINIASLYGLVAPDVRYYEGIPGWTKHPMYGATKAGIIALTRDFAARLAPFGVRVNALAPGGVVTGQDALTGRDARDLFKQRYTARIPMGRMAEPEDLAGPLVFLASDASRFITGQVLVLDGGYLCW